MSNVVHPAERRLAYRPEPHSDTLVTAMPEARDMLFPAMLMIATSIIAIVVSRRKR